MRRVSKSKYEHALKHPNAAWALPIIKRYQGFSGEDRTFVKRWGDNLKERTDAEVVFENMLRKLGVPYLTEFPVFVHTHYYFLDFLIKHPFRIAFEIDGGVHDSQGSYDLKRDGEVMKQERLIIVRYPNERVMRQPEGLLLELKALFFDKLKETYHGDIDRIKRAYPFLV